jgi:hypothetical protein
MPPRIRSIPARGSGRGGLDPPQPGRERGIAGFRRPEQVDPIVAAANLVLDKHDIATILRRK